MKYRIGAFLLILIASIRIAATYTIFNHTIDEPDHLASGMEWLTLGKYRYEDQHPPLARVLGALGPFLAGERFHPGPQSSNEGYRILGRDSHYDRTLALARAGILPLFWVSCVVVYQWAKRIAGPRAGFLAVLLWTTLPPVLAHSGLVTTDLAAAAMIGAVAIAALKWADNPGRRQSGLLGLALGCALLSKFSAVLFVPASIAAIYACHVMKNGRSHLGDMFERRAAIASVIAVTCIVVWAGYLFSFGRIELAHLRLPAPRFFSGIHSVLVHNERGHPSFLLGATSLTGFWYYYPAVLLIKTPLGLTALCLFLPWLLRRAPNRFGALLPFAFSASIVVSAMPSHINIGVRHVLPAYVGVCVSCGAAMASASGIGRYLALGCAALSILSGALAHPDYLAYTNEITAGHPERFVADSDLDWGQDMKRLGSILEREHARELAFTPFNKTYLISGHRLPRLWPIDTSRPLPGWNAASITLWKVYGVPAWPDKVPPPIRVGKSILLWYFPARAESNTLPVRSGAYYAHP